jgi:anaerobic selenocysteine-containing dehydrogenase
MRANGQGVSDVVFQETPVATELAPSARSAGSRDVNPRDGGAADAPALDAGSVFAAIERGDIRAAVIVGEDPVAGASDPHRVRKALAGLEFLAVLDVVRSQTTELASVVLPLAAFSESNGTFTNSERRIQRVSAALPPPAGLSNLEIISRIAEAAGAPCGSPDDAAVRRELVEAQDSIGLAGHGFACVGDRWGGDVLYSDGLATPDGLADVGVSDVDPVPLVFDPRWSDALEVEFSREAARLDLRPHVVRRYGS